MLVDTIYDDIEQTKYGMNYDTFDKFRGAWIGSIIGSALAEKSTDSEPSKILRYRAPNWLKAREAIANNIIQTQKIDVLSISNQLMQLWVANGSVNIRDRQTQNLSTSKIKTARKISGKTFLIDSDVMLACLSLMIFQSENQNVYAECTAQCNLKSEQYLNIQTDVLLWNYLLLLALNNELEPQKLNVGNIVKQVLEGVGVKTTPLTKKLDIVCQAWQYGLSLREVVENLEQIDSLNDEIMPNVSSAIALSFYCFISTPRDFVLSVKRASSLNSNLSLLVSAMTASLSGAYNSIGGIPIKWRNAANHNLVCQQAEQTAQKLFKIWLGTYHLDEGEILYDWQLHAVAFPQTIQVRQNFKIISQDYY